MWLKYPSRFGVFTEWYDGTLAWEPRAQWGNSGSGLLCCGQAWRSSSRWKNRCKSGRFDGRIRQVGFSHGFTPPCSGSFMQGNPQVTIAMIPDSQKFEGYWISEPQNVQVRICFLIKLSSNSSTWLLVGSWRFCIQYLPCSVSFGCILGGSVEFEWKSFYIGSLRVKLILACQEVLKRV